MQEASSVTSVCAMRDMDSPSAKPAAPPLLSSNTSTTSVLEGQEPGAGVSALLPGTRSASTHTQGGALGTAAEPRGVVMLQLPNASHRHRQVRLLRVHETAAVQSGALPAQRRRRPAHARGGGRVEAGGRAERKEPKPAQQVLQ